MTEYISREELTKALDSLCDRVCAYSKKQRWVMCGSCPLGSAFDVVEELHAADVVERKCGEWIPFDDGDGFGYQCSACNRVTYGCSLEIFVGDFKFCPCCGADMRRGES